MDKEDVSHNRFIFINGEYVLSHSKTFYALLNPANNEWIAKTVVGHEVDVQSAVSAARNAFEHGPWPRMSTRERASILKSFAALIRKNAELLGTIEALNVGKLHKECIHHEVPRAADNIEFYANAVEQDSLHSEVFVQRSKFLNKDGVAESHVFYEPSGVAGIIVPWNSPLMLGTWNIAPALATGNTVVLKPPIWAPLSLLQLGKLANEAGIPEGVLNIVPGEKEAGEALVGDTRVARISFTGSVEVGKEIQIANAKTRFAPVLLELGGKAANIVFPDVDLEFAVQGVARSIFRSQGQSCVAGSRLLIHEGIYQRFISKLLEHVRTMKIGDHMDENTDIGPLITKQHLDRVARYIAFGKAERAKLVYGGSLWQEGECAEGNFVQPTIFTDVTPDMKIFKEEIFGPVLCVTKFRNTEEAISLANSTRFGLSTNIWTQDTEHAAEVAAEVKAGMIWINTHFVRDLRTPFGGMKESGTGRSGGKWSLEFFTEPKMVCEFKEK